MADPLESPLSPAAIAYAWARLAEAAGIACEPGPPNAFGIPVAYGPAPIPPSGGRRILIEACRPEAWRETLQAVPDRYWLPAAQALPPGTPYPEASVAVPFWGAPCEGGIGLGPRSSENTLGSGPTSRPRLYSF